MEKGNNWKGGKRKISLGYIIVYAPKHPRAFLIGRTSKYVYKHRLVMEKHLGRYLKSSEWVHHKNRKRDDNRIENLELVISNRQWLKNFSRTHHGLEIDCPFCKEKFIIKK